MAVIDWRNKPLPEGHPFKGTTILFGQKRPASPAVPSVRLTDPPVRERFETQYEYEDAIAVWRERVGRIRAMEARAKVAGADLDDQGETK